MRKLEHRWRISEKEAGTRLLQFLRENCPEAPSVKSLKRAIDNKRCTVNHRIETFSSYILEEGDVVALSPDAFEEKGRVSSWKIPILFEDEELLIINKPAGLISDHRSLHLCFPQFKIELVHRLDKETSGVLVLARKAQMREKMSGLFKERAVRKVYLAIVDGVMEKEEGVIDNYLGKKQSYQGQTVYGAVDKKKGQHAVTRWRCLKRGKAASVLTCEPYTGRTHQLRVHLSEMGHPILGDTQYGKRFRCTFVPRRNLLHAYSVTFKHPSTGKEVKVIAPIPADIKRPLSKLRFCRFSGSFEPIFDSNCGGHIDKSI